MEQVWSLTDRTIKEIYFHARTKEGTIDIPVPTPQELGEVETEATVIRDLGFLLDAKMISQQNYDECVALAKAKFAASMQKVEDKPDGS